jgi:4-amino-4-deoxy-L-arabinose transferase-like glycosyltransferase
VFFSIPRSKLGSYILPALPPLAIVAGYGLERLCSIPTDSRRRILSWFLGVNFALAAVGILVLGKFLRPVDVELADDGIFLAILLVAGAAAMYLLGRGASSVPYGIGAIAIAMLATVLLGNRAREDASSLYTYRNLANAVLPYFATNCTLASYRHYVQSLPFYTRQRETRVEYWGELSEVSPPTAGKSPFLLGSEARLRQVWSSGACMILIANAGDLKALDDSLKPAPVIVGCEGKKFALYNGPLAAPPSASGCLKSEPEN